MKKNKKPSEKHFAKWRFVYGTFVFLILALATFYKNGIANYSWLQLALIYGASVTGIFLNVTWQLYQIFCHTRVKARVKEIKRKETDLNVRNHSGAPGTGKTSTAGFDAVELAKIHWQELCYKYWLGIGKQKKIYASGDEQKISDWEIIKQTYEYYQERPHLFPLLVSTDPIFVEERPCVILTKAHLIQKDPLPLFAVLVINELGAIVKLDKSKDKLGELNEVWRFPRHFGGWIIIMTEQDKNGAIIDIRRTTALNRYFLKQDKVLKPVILDFFVNLLKNHFIKKMSYYDSKSYGRYFEWFDKFKNACGYRKYTYFDFGNTENNVSVFKQKIRKFYLPSLLNFTYDDKNMRNGYRCRGQQLKLKEHTNLVLSRQNVIKLLESKPKKPKGE